MKADRLVVTDRKWSRAYDLDEFGALAFSAFRISGPTLLSVLSGYALRALAAPARWGGLASALARLREPD